MSKMKEHFIKFMSMKVRGEERFPLPIVIIAILIILILSYIF